MSEDDFDDGLVHNHIWAQEPAVMPTGLVPVAQAASVPTPSTVLHDDRMEQQG
ncbi:hypothetical protein ACFQU7_39370 [Pseudoroseomonas wenyumeiae]|uniref:hypothetical protein n=1 Tax=Teichococcus wenyumeiae TaxID=2478470 RepID=UPI001313E50B|nr:hypothetical protein [Pseudoroseomonas wenyumeiae]